MSARRSFSVFLAVLTTVVLLAGDTPARADNLIFKVSNLNKLSLKDLVEDLRSARVIVIGEQHDNRRHHEVQLKIIEALHESGRKFAVGLEMFREDSQADLDKWLAGKMTEEEFFKAYSSNWDMKYWPLYRDIFLYAREHEIPLLGLNIPRKIVNQVAREGFGSLSEEDRREIGFLSCNVDARYQETLARVLGSGHFSEIMFNNFCEAQVVWDTAMALNVMDYAGRNEDASVVVLAGNFHAWKRGIAAQISQRSDLESRVILPSQDTSFFNYDIFLEDADYVWWLERE